MGMAAAMRRPNMGPSPSFPGSPLTTRSELLELASRHGLDAAARERLLAWALAQGDTGIEGSTRRLPLALGVLAATLIGLGLVFWIAANWGSLGRWQQTFLLQAVVLATALGAWVRPGPARPALALLAFLGTGGLLAFIGQTYQTGADPWQLFALWALLGLPMALAVRHDAVWAPWALVTMAGVALWMQTHSGHRWRFESQDLLPQCAAWIVAALAVALLSPAARRFTGAGVWSLRAAVTLAAVIVAGTALGGLLQTRVAGQYVLGLAVVAAGVAVFASRRGFDLFALSALALALNGLLVAGLVRLLFSGVVGRDFLSMTLLVGLAAAGLLAFSVSRILRLHRQRISEGLT
jgi:uncharacterized membrane protein